jgi:hypothetical protein
MNICEKCNGELVEDAKFCILCGAVVQLKPQNAIEEDTDDKLINKSNETAFCKACQAPLRKEASFCVSCGEPAESQTGTAGIFPGVSANSNIAEEKDSRAEAGEKAYPDEVKLPVDFRQKPESDDQELIGEINQTARVIQYPKESVNNAEEPDSKHYIQDTSKVIENWVMVKGEEAAREADKLDFLTYGNGTVAKISFTELPETSKLILQGRVKCHSCNKLSIFSLDSNRNWGGYNNPAACPCGKKIEIGEYWNGPDNTIFVWAAAGVTKQDINDYPLSITISRILGSK